MKLGIAAEIWHTSPDLEKSARFYRALGQEVIEAGDDVSVLCGSLHLKLTRQVVTNPTIAYRSENTGRLAERVANLGISVEKESEGPIIRDPDGVRILLAQIDRAGVFAPDAPISSNLILPTHQLQRALKFWRTVGFLRIGGSVLRSGQWATIYDGKLPIILASPIRVSKPAILMSGGFTDDDLKSLKTAELGETVQDFKRSQATLVSPENLKLIYGQLG